MSVFQPGVFQSGGVFQQEQAAAQTTAARYMPWWKFRRRATEPKPVEEDETLMILGLA
jgi:hypothetical protein